MCMDWCHSLWLLNFLNDTSVLTDTSRHSINTYWPVKSLFFIHSIRIYLVLSPFFLGLLLLLSSFQGHTHGRWKFPGQGVQSELQPLAYTIATATQHLSHVCIPYHSSRQHQILNPLSEAKGRTHILMDTSWVRYPLSQKGKSLSRSF